MGNGFDPMKSMTAADEVRAGVAGVGAVGVREAAEVLFEEGGTPLREAWVDRAWRVGTGLTR